jgi:hypothetical protein
MHPFNHPARTFQLYGTVWHTLIINPKFYNNYYRSLNEKNILGLVISLCIAGDKIIFFVFECHSGEILKLFKNKIYRQKFTRNFSSPQFGLLALVK